MHTNLSIKNIATIVGIISAIVGILLGIITAIQIGNPFHKNKNSSKEGVSFSSSGITNIINAQNVSLGNESNGSDFDDHRDPEYHWWSMGPNEYTEYLDICYVTLDVTEIERSFNFVSDDKSPCGISGSGVRIGKEIVWGGAKDCKQSLRVTTKNCQNDSSGCGDIHIRTQAKVGLDTGSYNVAPIFHVRYPSGKEEDLIGSKGGYKFTKLLKHAVIINTSETK